MIPKIEITPEGYAVPTTEQINIGVWQVLRSVFGETISTVQGTPQYQLATSITAIIRDIYDHDVQLANQFDPRYANGVFQDAIGELYFMTRKLATNSVAEVTFRGLNGVVIPSGFAVQDVNGNTWNTVGQFNIGNNGEVTGQVVCATAGRIEANVGSINVIPSGLAGLDSVYNYTSAVAGYDEENRIDFEVRRQESVAINSKMTDEAARAAVLDINNVVDCYVISNPTDTTAYKGITDYPLIRNSICVSVVGGDNAEVAKAAFIKAGTGCSWNGNTSVTVYDDSYEGDKPAYDLRILRPAFIPVYFKVVVDDLSIVTFQDREAIKRHIINISSTGRNRIRIGRTLIPASYITGMPVDGVVTVLVSLDNATWTDRQKFGIDQFPSIDELRISVVEDED